MFFVNWVSSVMICCCLYNWKTTGLFPITWWMIKEYSIIWVTPQLVSFDQLHLRCKQFFWTDWTSVLFAIEKCTVLLVSLCDTQDTSVCAHAVLSVNSHVIKLRLRGRQWLIHSLAKRCVKVLFDLVKCLLYCSKIRNNLELFHVDWTRNEVKRRLSLSRCNSFHGVL